MVNEWLTCATSSPDLTLQPAAGSAPVEWRVSDAPVAYEAALAAMDARAAAIAAGSAPELVWLLEHPPLYTAGTSAKPDELIEARFPVHQTGRGGQFTYHGPGQRVAYVMLDLKRRGPDVRRFVATLEEWIIRTLAALQRARRAARGPHRRLGAPARQGRRPRGQDRRDRHPRAQWVTLHGIALNVEPELSHFSGIVPCGVSDAALRRHQPRRSRPAGDHGRGRHGAAARIRGAVRRPDRPITLISPRGNKHAFCVVRWQRPVRGPLGKRTMSVRLS